jgi:putative transposase
MMKVFYRRHLPHWQPPGATIFFTWRLCGSLPREAWERLCAERERLERQPLRHGETERERAIRHDKIIFARFDDVLGQVTHGPRWLEEPRIAQLMTDALFFHNGQRYDLIAFVVMPNHVHAVLRPMEIELASGGETQFVPISKITQGLKGYVAREANRRLDRTGQTFWQDESYDHWARDEAELARIVRYTESDPVRCGLVAHPEDWRWSSAWEREHSCLVGQTF